MNQNNLLARLTMVSGEVVDPSEVPAMVEMYGYSLVDPELQKFSFKNDDHGVSDIRVLREGTMIELWGTHEEDAFTLSALAKKLGWDVADIEILDSSMEQHLLQNFTNLKLREVLSGGDKSHVATEAAPTPPREVAVAVAPGPLPTTENGSAMDDLLRENARLQDEINTLVRENKACAARPVGTMSADADLINALMAASIDLNDNPVVQKLAEHGFKVRVTAERGV